MEMHLKHGLMHLILNTSFPVQDMVNTAPAQRNYKIMVIAGLVIVQVGHLCTVDVVR
jgi:hypothetical protein